MEWIPSIITEGAHGNREVSLRTQQFTEGIIYINDEINHELANRVLSQLLYLEKENIPAKIYINSPGGSVDAGLVIYDALQGIKNDITIICAGMAASMAAIILAGGRKGKRYIYPHSKVLIHEPMLTNGYGGSASSIKSMSDMILETRTVLNGILAKHTGKTEEEILKGTAYDNIMTAKQAVEFGICDKIITTLTV